MDNNYMLYFKAIIKIILLGIKFLSQGDLNIKVYVNMYFKLNKYVVWQ